MKFMKKGLRKLGLALLLATVTVFTLHGSIALVKHSAHIATIGSKAVTEVAKDTVGDIRTSAIEKRYRTDYSHPKMFAVTDKVVLNSGKPADLVKIITHQSKYFITVTEAGQGGTLYRELAVSKEMFDIVDARPNAVLLLYDDKKKLLYNEADEPMLLKVITSIEN